MTTPRPGDKTLDALKAQRQADAARLFDAVRGRSLEEAPAAIAAEPPPDPRRLTTYDPTAPWPRLTGPRSDPEPSPGQGQTPECLESPPSAPDDASPF